MQYFAPANYASWVRWCAGGSVLPSTSLPVVCASPAEHSVAFLHLFCLYSVWVASFFHRLPTQRHPTYLSWLVAHWLEQIASPELGSPLPETILHETMPL